MDILNLQKFLSKIIESKKMKIYVIKGIEFTDFSCSVKPLIELDKNETITFDKTLSRKILSQINSNLTQETAFYAKYSDFRILKDLNLLGIIDGYGYEIEIVDYNFFGPIYAERINDLSLIEKILNDFNSEQDTPVQRIFSDIEINDYLIIYSYNELEVTIKRVHHWNDGKKTNIEVKQMNDDYVTITTGTNIKEVVFLVLHAIAENLKIAVNFNSKVTLDELLTLIISSLVKIEYPVFRIKDEGFKEDPQTDVEFINILKRIDSKYTFRDIPVYENPSLNNNLVQISQYTIINEIYQNAVLANENKRFYDTFVTASTGAGKSLMFQIPAVRLAEEKKLMTIVISPLIGLMNDQVSNLKKMTDLAATINSEYTPYEKDKIKEEIMKKSISILYISPETLLSNSDVSSLIGDREIGLMVIDEAHTVATWGKSFRPDYWYLGDFLRSLRSKVKKSFPIVAFTATATYGGVDDMYYDIVDSLYMNVKKPYIGKVKRDNISFRINHVNRRIDYRKEKNELVVAKLNKFIQNEEQTLVYFPYKSSLKQVHDGIKANFRDNVGIYQGGLDKLEKNETLRDFKNGTISMVLATKAFGMGIDIDDIKNIYHYAPTGNLADYVQEIGRAARKPNIRGYAHTDFFEQDFKFINTLFGLSSVKLFEVIGVMTKILDIYNKQKKRNLLVSPEEFAHIFNGDTSEEIDNRLKTTLLVIKKDLEDIEKGYSLIFKPRSMFTKGLFLINDEHLDFFNKIGWMPFLSIFKTKDLLKRQNGNEEISYMGDVYELDFKELWQNKYRELAFGSFKAKLFEDKLDDVRLCNRLKSKLLLEIETLNEHNFNSCNKSLMGFLQIIENILDYYKQMNSHFTISDFAKKVIQYGPDYVKSQTQSELVSSSVLYLLNSFELSNNTKSHFLRFNTDTEKYEVTSSLYKSKKDLIIKSAIKSLSTVGLKRKHHFLEDNKYRSDSIKANLILIFTQIFELIGVATYKIKAGDRPEFFIRINNENELLKMTKPFYNSVTITRIRRRHENSKDIMHHFFTKLDDDNSRWNLIEDYFLGNDIMNEVVANNKKSTG